MLDPLKILSLCRLTNHVGHSSVVKTHDTDFPYETRILPSFLVIRSRDGSALTLRVSPCKSACPMVPHVTKSPINASQCREPI